MPSTDPISLNIPIELVDSDGDALASVLGLTFTRSGEGIQNHSADLVGDPHTYSSTLANPHIIGSDFADTLTGDTSINVLFGNDGNDIISGAAGNDVLIGGAGKDTMIGGSEADVYKFNSLGDSGNTIALADVINGWDASDKIDFTAIDADINSAGDQAFAFAGNNPGTVNNSITWTEDGVNTNVSVDTNGAAGAEMMVVLTGIGLNLNEADFIL